MKKILFFIDTLGYGGAEKVLVNLINNMDKSKYDITLMTVFDSGSNKQYLKEGVKYKYIFKRVFRGNVAFFKLFRPEYLYKKYIKEEYDVVIAYLEGNTTRILSGCPYSNTKKLAWIHVEMDMKTRLYPYRNLKECVTCYKKYDKIVGVSKNVIDSFKAHLGEWNNLTVKYNTVDTDYIKKCAAEETDAIDNDVFSAISVGRLIEQKSYSRLLRIHKRLIDSGYRHKLYIIGEGGQHGMLQRYIDTNNLHNTAKLLGFCDNPWKYVAKADLFICSSLKEGFSTAVTESLIVGTPVVTTLCSGMKELLGDSEYGLITQNDEESLYNGILALIKDRTLLNRYKQKAIERGRQFDTTATVKAVEELIDEVLE